MKLTVGCILYNQDGKILLAKRAKKPFKDTWTIVGGKVEENETVEQCVIREVKEELGTNVKNLRFLTSGMEKNFKGHLFEGEISGKITLKNDELKEVRFFSMKDILSLDIGFNHKKLILDNVKGHSSNCI